MAQKHLLCLALYNPHTLQMLFERSSEGQHHFPLQVPKAEGLVYPEHIPEVLKDRFGIELTEAECVYVCEHYPASDDVCHVYLCSTGDQVPNIGNEPSLEWHNYDASLIFTPGCQELVDAVSEEIRSFSNITLV